MPPGSTQRPGQESIKIALPGLRPGTRLDQCNATIRLDCEAWISTTQRQKPSLNRTMYCSLDFTSWINATQRSAQDNKASRLSHLDWALDLAWVNATKCPGPHLDCDLDCSAWINATQRPGKKKISKLPRLDRALDLAWTNAKRHPELCLECLTWINAI